MGNQNRIAIHFINLCRSNMAFVVFVVFVCALSVQTPTAVSSLCHLNESSALFQFKQGLDLQPGKLRSWRKGSNCCQWEGVSCDKLTGFVTALQLSDITSQFDDTVSGIDPSLLQLQHLRLLDLNSNDFGEEIPKGLAKLTRLTHLDLSYCHFSGQIPSAVLQMTQLVCLNLSGNEGLQLHDPNFGEVLQSLRDLVDLSLDGVNISMSGKQVSSALSSSLPMLQTLSLLMCNIQGPLGESLSSLSSLSYLDLGYNNLTLVPEFVANLGRLRVLKLAKCSIAGDFPSSVLFLHELEELDVSLNRELMINVPLDDDRLKKSNIWALDLSGIKHMPNALEVVSRLTKLTHLRLESSGIAGSFPLSWHSVGISVLALYNNAISGPIPEYLNSLFNLTYLDLSNNRLNGRIASNLPNLPNLALLDLSNNHLSGSLPSFNRPNLNLEHLFLGHNSFTGNVTFSGRELPNLQSLDLSNNNLRDTINISQFSGMNYLFSLDISENSRLILDVSNDSDSNTNIPPFVEIYLSNCGIKSFPYFLHKLSGNLRNIDLRGNRIRGKIPSWIWSKQLEGLSISHNLIDGIDGPSNETELADFSLQFLNVSKNQITGPMPTFFCSLSSLEVIDMSDNKFSGVIPDCFYNMGIPAANATYKQSVGLVMLNLNTNLLKGKIPKSLSNCSELQALDLGNNQLNDTFPFWLGSLNKLRILNLRSNLFSGHITLSRPAFPSLQILDISGNQFSGSLPAQLFDCLESMKVFHSTSQLKFIQVDVSFFLGINYAPITQRVKGIDLVIPKLIEGLTIIDLSNNLFTGDIPEGIGALQGLHELNISNNNVGGFIPTSMGNMKLLESLDLSNNNLSGRIPENLSRLTFLSIFNVSFNNLEGRIPEGGQFSTFEGSSYEGNSKLCGDQVKKQCSVRGDADDTHREDSIGDEENDQEREQWFYGASGIGFAAGLGILTVPILFNERVGNWYWNQIDRAAKCVFYFYYVVFRDLGNMRW